MYYIYGYYWWGQLFALLGIHHQYSEWVYNRIEDLYVPGIRSNLLYFTSTIDDSAETLNDQIKQDNSDFRF